MNRWFRKGLQLTFNLIVLALVSILGAYIYLSPQLPSVDALQQVQFQVPLKVYSSDGALIGEFGEKKRTPISISQTPALLINAVLAAEDDRFYDHPGVDYEGLIRAAWLLLKTGEKKQGGSTITMQVARNFFLTSEKTFLRKAIEVLLAFKIERTLEKDEILNLYLNKIFLGHRSYGFAAAAHTYYSKDLKDLSLPQIATLAGIPKAPSRFNPISDPQRSLVRTNYVLNRMFELGYIGEEDLKAAIDQPISARLHNLDVEVSAHYAAEMVRAEMVNRYGPAAYTDGYEVITTINTRLQRAANIAVKKGLLAYDRRHGYRGAEKRLRDVSLSDQNSLQKTLKGYPNIQGLRPAIVTAVTNNIATLYSGESFYQLGLEALKWARPFISEDKTGPAPTKIDELLAPGDLVRIAFTKDGHPELSQLPAAEAALIALSPTDGAITSLVGGFDFQKSRFNRITQANRQPGSNFKPCIYAAALSKGYTRASIINDAPMVFDGGLLAGEWRPENYSGEFIGPIPLSLALATSRNIVAVRLLSNIGVSYGRNYCLKFGYPADKIPNDLSLALGSGAITPLELIGGYALIANGGYRITPYIIDTILNQNGEIIFESTPQQACGMACLPVKGKLEFESADENIVDLIDIAKMGKKNRRQAERVLPATDAYLMTSMLKDVIQIGTGQRAKSLGRPDIAGKTGTTNDLKDAWFSGFTPDLVATVWVGFDKPRSLGQTETGSKAALPIWIDFMQEALNGVEVKETLKPPGIVSIRIDPATGKTAGQNTPGAKFELFRTEYAPQPLGEEVKEPGSDRAVLF